ncbi:MAG: DUF3040 domain-containing protein [Actinomycetes bacterium]
MPLSEHEQRLLAQMEQQLLAEDPKFASAMNGRRSVMRRRLAVGVLGVLAGLVLLVFAVAQQIILLGVLAFLVMLGGAVYAFSAPGSRSRGPLGVVDGSGVRAPRSAGGHRSGTFMQRLEERWDRRRDERWR